jgi:serine protease Do
MNPNPHRTSSPRRYYLGALALILVGVIVGLGLSAGLGIQRAPSAVPAVEAAQAGGTSAMLAAQGSLESPFVPVVERALPAVVFIDVRKRVGTAESEDPQDELMRRFFGDGARRPRVQPSSGSGFIIDRDGRIMTNNHVVREAQDITVTLNDRRQFKAKVVGTDPQTDVAVIKLEGPPNDLPVLPLGDSEKMRVGDWAIAIGNPLGELRGSVTVGIISAQGRSNLNIFGNNDLQFQDFIQTDASINFGNSGGPLCNIRGEAIGINTAINPSGQGIGFAIPINLAKHVADQLIATGKVQRSWMGVTLADLNPDLAEGFGVAANSGVLVQEVLPGTPAEKGGMRRGDIIVEYEGQPVSEMQKLRLRVADTPNGSKVRMVVMRDGRRVPLDVTLGARPSDPVALRGGPGGEGETEQVSGPAGIRVRALTSDERSELKLKGGVLVTDVAAGSAAEEAGLQANDVIEEVGGKPVASATEFSNLVGAARKSGKKNAVLLVRRGEGSQFVPVKITE